MPQQYKIDKATDLKKYFDEAEDYIFNDYRKLDVEKINELREELRKLNDKYKVVKNNYVKVIAKEKDMEDLGDNLVGPTGIAFADKDANEVAKVLFSFAKTSELDVKGGFIGNKVLGKDELEALSKLPGRDQLIGMVMATLNAPLTNFVMASNDVIGRMVRALDEVRKQKEA